MFGIIFILAGLFVLIGWIYAIKGAFELNKKNASVKNHGFDELQRFTEESTREAQKSITPFEMGGYNLEQGNSWNNNDNGCNNFNDFGNGMF